MNLLVCGGAGFIGSAFVRRRLRQTQDRIVVVDAFTYAGNRSNLADVEHDEQLRARWRLVEGDIADADLVNSLVAEEGPDAIVNFAAESHVDRSILDAASFLRTGVLGVHVLLEAVRTLTTSRASSGRPPTRYVQVSTDEVYGPSAGSGSVESDALRPSNPYSAAKGAGDLLTLAYHRTYGLDTVITRGANTFGPHQYPEKIVPLFTTNALRGLPLPVYGDGLQRRQWLYVDDHADAIGVVLDRGEPGGIYNIPGGEELTNLALTGELLRLTGQPESLLQHVEDRPGHDRRYALDGSRIAALGWARRVPVFEGLRLTVAWYRDNETWWRSLMDADWDAFIQRQYGRSRQTAAAGDS